MIEKYFKVDGKSSCMGNIEYVKIVLTDCDLDEEYDKKEINQFCKAIIDLKYMPRICAGCGYTISECDELELITYGETYYIEYSCVEFYN